MAVSKYQSERSGESGEQRRPREEGIGVMVQREYRRRREFHLCGVKS